MPRRLFFVVNPIAGKGRSGRIWPGLEKKLAGNGMEYSWEYTSGYRQGLQLAEQAIADGYNTIIAVGGDGTLWEVVNKVAEMGRRDITVGVLPTGTGNDFCRSLGIPSEPFLALEIILRGEVRTIDLGRINGKFFVNALGVGFDSLVAQAANNYHGVLKGKLVYLWAILKTLKNFQSPLMRLEIDGIEYKDRFVLVAVGNAKYYGGGLMIAPDAMMDDGLFDLVLIRDINRLEILKTLPRLSDGSHLGHPRVEVVRGREVIIHADPPQLFQADGEIVGQSPQMISILPSFLQVICP
ncbi:MAG: diacylglycerol kinase family protein [Halanaerobium sp.]|nr:diacylglycerol kinase family protein [Halanaerobium sp.]